MPLGFQHEIGVSFGKASVNGEDFAVEGVITQSSDSLNTNGTKKLLVNEELGDFSQKHTIFGLFYKLKVVHPITESLFFNVGINYSLNLTRSADFVGSNPNSVVRSSDIADGLRIRMLYNISSIDFGLSYSSKSKLLVLNERLIHQSPR